MEDQKEAKDGHTTERDYYAWPRDGRIRLTNALTRLTLLFLAW